jgi:predicted nucleic acid-binding protein
LILLDTNVLVHAVDTASVEHQECRDVVTRAMSAQLEAVLVPQVLTEFCAVVTSARRVASPLSPAQSSRQVRDWIDTVPLRFPNMATLDQWTALVGRGRRVAQNVHDLFLVAQMYAHGIGELCTLNVSDFTGHAGIAVRRPLDL